MLEKLEIDDIQNEEQKHLARTVGLGAYISLVKEYGGTSVYVFKEDSITKNIRDEKIKKEFNGENYLYLAKKYNLTEQRIRAILNGRNEVLKGQISFDDMKIRQ